MKGTGEWGGSATRHAYGGPTKVTHLVKGLIAEGHEWSSTSACLHVDTLVLPEQISHLLLADAHSHPGTIRIRSNVLGQLRHIRLAETLQLCL